MWSPAADHTSLAPAGAGLARPLPPAAPTSGGRPSCSRQVVAAARRRAAPHGGAAADSAAQSALSISTKATSSSVSSAVAEPVAAAPADPQPTTTPSDEASQVAAVAPASHALTLVTCRTLAPQATMEAAVQQLRAAVQELPASAGAYPSGLVRLELPLPHGTKALWWLRGQQAPPASVQQPHTSEQLLQPRIYFSPRRTTAADTEGSQAAGAASAGAASVAGAGAAWLWRGAPGQPLCQAVVQDMQRFLTAASPRIRAFGGSRFNCAQLPAAEWREFGSFCFMIPRLEFLEASGCTILSCTVAWDLSHCPAGTAGSRASSGSSAAVGFSSCEAAVADALAALDAVQAPLPPSAGTFKLQRHVSRHVPDEGGWHDLMEGTHAQLAAAAAATAAAARQQREAEAEAEAGAAAAGGSSLDACTPLLRVNPEAAREEYLLNGQEGLDDLLAALEGGFEATVLPQDGGLTKVVLARRTDVSISGTLDPLCLLEALQERDPRAYQLMLQMPSGATFLGSTPECLYTRTGSAVASEAVAGTRARGAGGDVEKDFWLAFDLLRSHKDHVEFSVVRDWVQQALSGVCEEVQVDVFKSVLKQGAVQHLYGKLSAQLKPGSSDAHLLAALHPTPAVCGRPREDALSYLADSEPFDRGFYAGPFGWISQEAAEFVVAIRSALIQPATGATATAAAEADAAEAAEQLLERRASHAAAGPSNGSTPSTPHTAAGTQHAATQGAPTQGSTQVSLYAGVGIVNGSDTALEWAELDLKVRQYERLLQAVPPLSQAPNINLLWARLLVEELCRLGCNTFCVAPGSRSSPLTVAVAQHPRARVVPCIDERSLGFWAMGHGRATGRPAVVITSSGTAVANLLPAVVEASQSGVPLLLLTGDRPAELRDTGANQTIDQVKMFGTFTRWHADLPAPVDAMPARTILSAVDTAVQRTMGLPAGPVHLNCQFREPLAPVEAGSWDRACLQGLQHWEASSQPFTAVSSLQPPAGALQLPALPLPASLSPSSPSASAGMSALLGAGPAAGAVLQAIAGAQRGLIVAAELTHPEDVVAAAQLSQLLGWPLVADILSGLRAGVKAPTGPASEAAAAAAAGPAVIHHFDNLLLLDRQQWGHLRPDVVLQLGGHLTSKRTNQFLEWCCLDQSSSSSGSSSSGGASSAAPPAQQQPVQWILADRSPKRHDQFHLLSHRLQAPLPLLAAAVQQQLAAASAAAAAAASPAAALDLQQRRWQQRSYCRLLQLLDAEASAAVDAALQRMPELTEPQVARSLAQQLPPGEGLFVGNSMPIRDLDMYAAPAPPPPAAASSAGTAAAAGSTAGPLPQGVVTSGLGAPVGANRGASGIDGVLSTAAGFADGLGRGTTLVVGDLSFLHDINGLNLLRSGEARPPLTVVLINNSGGGIFSFLPIADALPEDVFTPLWATPQHVDLEGMCRAHGIPHQKVTAAEDLHAALRSAWGCNRHSVVEVITSRYTNVDRHREIQAAVKQAVGRTLGLLQQPQQPQQQGQQAATATSLLSAAALAGAAGLGLGGSGSSSPACAPFELAVQSASYHAYSLPLAKPLTTTAVTSAGARQQQRRRGFLLRVSLVGSGSGSASLAHGVGEVAPLPGLHAETLEEAERQLALLCQLLGGGVKVPLTAALLGGRLSSWLSSGLGVAPESLLPSVRCGLEAAVLSAVAQHQGHSLAQLLGGCLATLSSPRSSSSSVAVNGLLNCQGSPEEAAAEAAAMLQQQPFTALKIKVGRREDPLQDAAAVLAIRQAVGPGVVLRADANRRWTLEQAVQFGQAVSGAGLQYVEEPLRCTADLPELYRRTALPLALDETVDEGLAGPGAADAAAADALCEGVVALVLKPSVLGGLERTAELACWAAGRGMHAVVSSAFESCLGISQLAQLAAALDAASVSSSGSGSTHHGLATLSWLAEDLLPPAAQQLLQPHTPSDSEVGSGGSSGPGMAINTAAAEAVQSGSVALALGLQQQEQQQHAVAPELAAVAAGAVAAAAAAAGGASPLTQPRRLRCCVHTSSGSYDFSMLELSPLACVGSSSSNGNAYVSANASANVSANGRADAAASPKPPVLFLHGFLGAAEDWLPLMHALGLDRRCIALDLPGHGSTTVVSRLASSGNGGSYSSSNGSSSGSNGSSSGNGNGSSGGSGVYQEAYSLEAAAAAVAAVVQQEGLQGCLVVGYSLGARLALLLAARWPSLFSGVVSVSGTPGLPDPSARAERASRDAALASALQQGGLDSFIDHWYQLPMWAQLRASPRFQATLQQRRHGGDAQQLAAVLAAASSGLAPSLWRELQHAAAAGSLPPLLLVAGQEDGKFVGIARKLAATLAPAGNSSTHPAATEQAGPACSAHSSGDSHSHSAAAPGRVRVAVVPACGHAVHIERPLDLLAQLQQFP